jgi:hypothetical protein
MSSNYYGAKLWYIIIRGHIKYLPAKLRQITLTELPGQMTLTDV